MENHQHISIGENLKNIRKSMGFRQQEISGGDITRNLVSLIENNKTPLYEKVARLLAKNMNNLAMERNMDVYIDPEDMLNPQRYEAKQRADQLLAKLKDNLSTKEFYDLEKQVDTVDLFFREWNIPEKKAEIYEVLGDIFYAKKDKLHEYSYYMKAYETCTTSPCERKKGSLALKLSSSCIGLKKYEEAIRINSLILNSSSHLYETLTSSLNFNIAIAYRMLGNNVCICVRNIPLGSKG